VSATTRTTSPAPPLRRLALIALMCLILGGLGGLLAATVTRPAPVRASFVPPREPARDFRLRDQDGRWTTLAQARGKVVVLTFLYSTCHDLCPAQAGEIAGAVGKVGGTGVMVYGVSVDPVGDTPARARGFLKRHGLYGGPVKFLVGTRAQLRPVWHDYGIVPIGATPAEAEAAAEGTERYLVAHPHEKPRPYATPSPRPAPAAAEQGYPDTNDLRYRGHERHSAGPDFEHSAYVMLIDKHGEQRVGIPFEELDADSLARDLRILLAEP
jgi:cytochrome oxidase Cu insertion factor (SCO1/SenC/PrrC family)